MRRMLRPWTMIAGLTLVCGSGVLIQSTEAQICPFPPKLVEQATCRRASTTEAGNETRKCVMTGENESDCRPDLNSFDSCWKSHWTGSKNGECIKNPAGESGSGSTTNCKENAHTRLIMIYKYLSMCDGRQSTLRETARYCRCSSVQIDPPETQWVPACECEELPMVKDGWRPAENPFDMSAPDALPM